MQLTVVPELLDGVKGAVAAAGETAVRRANPKRAAREAAREVAGHGASTAAQAALKRHRGR